jgi:hypothetical protein
LGSRPSSKKSASPVRHLCEEEAAALKKNGCRNNSLPNIILIIVAIFLFYHFLQTLLPSLHRKLGFSIGRNQPERKKECKTISVSARLLLIVCFFFFFPKLGLLRSHLLLLLLPKTRVLACSADTTSKFRKARLKNLFCSCQVREDTSPNESEFLGQFVRNMFF